MIIVRYINTIKHSSIVNVSEAGLGRQPARGRGELGLHYRKKGEEEESSLQFQTVDNHIAKLEQFETAEKL